MAPIEYRVTIEAEDKPTQTWRVEVWVRYVQPDGTRTHWSPACQRGYTYRGKRDVAPFVMYQEILRKTLV